jgi:hypothetical protein
VRLNTIDGSIRPVTSRCTGRANGAAPARVRSSRPIYQEEVLRLGLSAYGANQLAIDRIGPTVMLFGSDAQKKKFLPAMLFHSLTRFGDLRCRTTSCWRKRRFSASSRARLVNRDRIASS